MVFHSLLQWTTFCQSLKTAATSVVSDSGVGFHFLLQCLKVKNESEVAQSCPTLHDPIDGSPPGSPIPGILQARVLEWGAIAFSEFETMGTQNRDLITGRGLFAFVFAALGLSCGKRNLCFGMQDLVT